MARTTRETLDAYFAALNGEDWDAVRTLFVEDAVLDGSAVGFGERRGLDAIVKFYQRVFEKFPTHADKPQTFIVDGGLAAVSIAFEGTTADGHACEFSAVDIFHMDDGMIVKLEQWYDTAEIARQVSG
jgi:ketosteroid isomerase-like protein